MNQTKDTALVLIDIQNDYFPGGNCELNQPEMAAKNASRLLDCFRSKAWPVVHIQHLMPKERNLPFLVEGTIGSEIHELVAPIQDEPIIKKRFPNAFQQTHLQSTLKDLGIQKLVICGMMTHMCVSATSRIAMELSYQVTIVEDATATRDLMLFGELVPAEQVQRANLAALNGVIANVESIETLAILED